ncbi:hypothetical protein NC652_026341 [Populus alba x Populus x berolinensis]|nr:hypothetical protein NC652_026341 [Populus alba x Populus x berolinensis]
MEREKKPTETINSRKPSKKESLFVYISFQEMAKWSSCFLVSGTVLILMAMGLASTVQGSGELGITFCTTRSSTYNKGSITEYMADDGDEFEMNTEINGCIPATNKYTES